MPQTNNNTKKNPPWDREELILALDLYFDNPKSKSDVRIAELSQTLNRLNNTSNLPNPPKFRNINGVYMKLMNFRRFDPSYEGKGLDRGNKLEQIVWNEFSQDRIELKKIANTIRQIAKENVRSSLPVSVFDNDDQEHFPEGKILYKMHRYRERNQRLIAKAKGIYLLGNGALNCEVCGFLFSETYGELGKDYIEAHHDIPVSMMASSAKTKISDIRMVCSNCHRMLHRRRPWVSVDQLKQLIS